MELSAGNLQSQDSFVRNPDDAFEIKQKTFLLASTSGHGHRSEPLEFPPFAYSALESPLNYLFTKIKYFSLFLPCSMVINFINHLSLDIIYFFFYLSG